MISDTIVDNMDPEEFDVFAYLDGVPVAEDTVSIYTNVPASRKLEALKKDRATVVQEMRERIAEMVKQGKAESLSITDEDEDLDTEYDDEINSLLEELEKTKLVFHLTSVAPKLVRSINNSYDAKKKDGLTSEENDKYEDKRTSDILSRAIKSVTVGATGKTDPRKWDGETLAKLEEVLYKEQSARLLNALFDMVYSGSYFDRALTLDF